MIYTPGMNERRSSGSTADFERNSTVFKALGEPIRLKILHLIAGGEVCACDVLKSLSITQSTLSHHMKTLMESGLVTGRKDATWMFYSIRKEGAEELHHLIDTLLMGKDR